MQARQASSKESPFEWKEKALPIIKKLAAARLLSQSQAQIAQLRVQ